MNIEKLLQKSIGQYDKESENQFQIQLQRQLSLKRQIIQSNKQKIQTDLQQRISSIILVKKRKFDQNLYIQIAQKLKIYSISCKNLIQTFFKLLLDQQKLMVYAIEQVKNLIKKFRFSLFRSIHNMNRIIIKQCDNYQKAIQQQKNMNNQNDKKKSINSTLKKKKKKKGKNSKMSIQQTGFMYKWILQNFDNPYPSQQEKQKLSNQSKISISKVNYWFINMRERTLKKLLNGDKQLDNSQRKKKNIQMSQDMQSIQQSQAEYQSEQMLKQQS